MGTAALRFLGSALAATAAAGVAVAVLQGGMSFPVVAVGEEGSWLVAAALVVAIGVATAGLVGVPALRLVGALPLAARTRRLLAPLVAAVIGTLLFAVANRALGPTPGDLARVLVIALAFFATQDAVRRRGAAGPRGPTAPRSPNGVQGSVKGSSTESSRTGAPSRTR